MCRLYEKSSYFQSLELLSMKYNPFMKRNPLTIRIEQKENYSHQGEGFSLSSSLALKLHFPSSVSEIQDRPGTPGVHLSPRRGQEVIAP